MPFFCPITGTRLVAPGLHTSVDAKHGVATFDHTEAAEAAESAATAAIALGRRHATEAEPAPDVQQAARNAANKALETHANDLDESPADESSTNGLKTAAEKLFDSAEKMIAASKNIDSAGLQTAETAPNVEKTAVSSKDNNVGAKPAAGGRRPKTSEAAEA